MSFTLRSGNARSVRFWSQPRPKACVPSSSAMILKDWCALCRIAFPRRGSSAGARHSRALAPRVAGSVEAPDGGLELPLDIRGTAFQQRVWTAIRDIPAGSTASYRELAKRIGAPKAVRAVAQACAANGIAVAIPCHRVVRTDGSTSGYRWGVGRQRALLAREKAA